MEGLSGAVEQSAGGKIVSAAKAIKGEKEVDKLFKERGVVLLWRRTSPGPGFPQQNLPFLARLALAVYAT